MDHHPNLTEDDVELLKGMPMKAGLMVIVLDTSGVVEAGREMFAAARVVAEAVQRFPDNRLVASLHAELHDAENYGRKRGGDKDATDRIRTSDPMVAMAAFVGELDKVLDVVDTKIDPTEAHGYKQWIMACADAAAGAAKEGSRFGVGGKRISDEEAAYLGHLRHRLGLG